MLIQMKKAFYNAGDGVELVEDFDQAYEIHFGEAVDVDHGEDYDQLNDVYDNPVEGYFTEEYHVDQINNGFHFEDPDRLLEAADSSPEELDITTDLEEGHCDDQRSGLDLLQVCLGKQLQLLPQCLQGMTLGVTMKAMKYQVC